jgi:ribosomal protein S19E (S16A)
VDIVKTSKSKELAPYDEDWYFVRAGVFPVGIALGSASDAADELIPC